MMEVLVLIKDIDSRVSVGTRAGWQPPAFSLVGRVEHDHSWRLISGTISIRLCSVTGWGLKWANLGAMIGS